MTLPPANSSHLLTSFGFTQPDPLAFLKSEYSVYSYCHADPINFIDPTGLFDSKKEAEDERDFLFPTFIPVPGVETIHKDRKTGEYYISLDPSGMMPYTNGPTLKRYYGGNRGLFPSPSGYYELPCGINIDRQVLSNVNTSINAYSLVNGAKLELIDYAAKSSLTDFVPSKQMDRIVEAFGKKGIGAYSKIAHVTGKVLFGASVIITSIEVVDYYEKGGDDLRIYGKAALDVTMGYVATLGPVGLGISATYFLIDLVFF